MFIRFLFILFMILLCPCITGSPGGLCITDTRRDEWLGLPSSPPRTSRTLWLSWLVVTSSAPVASCDRRCVAVALSSSLWIADDPLPRLRFGGPGWCLTLIPTSDNWFDLPDLTHDLTVLQYSSWDLAYASSSWGEFVLCVSFYPLSSLMIYDTSHHPE